MEQIRIIKLFKDTKNKEGKPIEFKGRDGKMRSATKIAIKTDRHGDAWLSALVFDATDPMLNLKEGDEATIVVTEKNGYLNFKLPTAFDRLEARVEAIEKHLLRKAGEAKREAEIPGYKAEEINPDDIPF